MTLNFVSKKNKRKTINEKKKECKEEGNKK